MGNTPDKIIQAKLNHTLIHECADKIKDVDFDIELTDYHEGYHYFGVVLSIGDYYVYDFTARVSPTNECYFSSDDSEWIEVNTKNILVLMCNDLLESYQI